MRGMQICICLGVFWMQFIHGAVVPPPWADPKVNPCAIQPGGWQMLYWPPDGKCYKIFQKGHPCPETMELSPPYGKNTVAECKCPPTTAFSHEDEQCHELFTKGPCRHGQFFAPAPEKETPSKKRFGVCKNITACEENDHVFWPHNSQCYPKLSKGPCPLGQLLTETQDKLGTCRCHGLGEMDKYYSDAEKACFEHYTKGPCRENGHLFLPGGKCGCDEDLPHYHDGTKKCYEIGSIGPCRKGHHFQTSENSLNNAAGCVCKDKHIFWEADQNCYRPYTQGPCTQGRILVNGTTCAPIPCRRNFLYFPDQQSCYRIGTQGPCRGRQVVLFDFETRPSLDGASYNGVCGCPTDKEGECDDRAEPAEPQGEDCAPGMAAMPRDKKCYRLYSQGPCAAGQWVVPQRQGRMPMFHRNKGRIRAKCECRLGYVETTKSVGNRTAVECLPPSFVVANYLRKTFFVKV